MITQMMEQFQADQSEAGAVPSGPIRGWSSSKCGPIKGWIISKRTNQMLEQFQADQSEIGEVTSRTNQRMEQLLADESETGEITSRPISEADVVNNVRVLLPLQSNEF